MSMTIHYYGKMADLGRVEELEDRVVDMALEIGAVVRVWRSWPHDDRTRIVRGLIIDVMPGQDTTSLLISPEGWLVPLPEIKAAENGTLVEPPYCQVKTQYGSVEGHVALVELLSYLKQHFFPDLYVSDETGYWDTRDLPALVDKLAQMKRILDALTDQWNANSLSPEAMEDPEIVATRVERIARLVQRSLARPPEHPPVHFDDDVDWDDVDERQWDASYKEQRRLQERLQRAIEEQLQGGADPEEALEAAMRNEGIVDVPGGEDVDDLGLEWRDSEPEPEEDPWRESLPAGLDGPFNATDDERQPLLQIASDLYVRVFNLMDAADEKPTSHIATLMQGLGQIGGGLAQALGEQDSDRDGLDRGLALVQLKRAWRGVAFAQGALFALRAEGVLGRDRFEELHESLQQLAKGIGEELARIREERGG